MDTPVDLPTYHQSRQPYRLHCHDLALRLQSITRDRGKAGLPLGPDSTVLYTSILPEAPRLFFQITIVAATRWPAAGDSAGRAHGAMHRRDRTEAGGAVRADKAATACPPAS